MRFFWCDYFLLHRVVEAPYKPFNPVHRHAFSLQVEGAPLLETLLWKPDGILNRQKHPVYQIAGDRRIHRVMRPVKPRPFDAVFFSLVPDGGRGVGIPQLRPEEIRLGLFDKRDCLLICLVSLSGEPHNHISMRRYADLLEQRDGGQIIFPPRRLVHDLKHRIAARFDAEEHAFAPRLGHQLDSLLVPVVAAVKRIPFEAIAVPDHHSKEFFKPALGDVERVVEERQRRNGPDVAQSIKLLLDEINGQVRVLPRPLREPAKGA